MVEGSAIPSDSPAQTRTDFFHAPALREHVLPTEWQVRTVLGDQKMISRETIEPSRESIGNSKRFFQTCGRPSTSVLSEYVLPGCMLLQFTFNGNFDVFAARI